MQEQDSRSVKATPEPVERLREGEFLRQYREALLEDWEQAVHALYADRSHRPPWLIDHMPSLIAALVDAVEQGPEQIDLRLTDEHAVTRLDQGFDLGEVAYEYALLRKCMLRRLEADGRPLVPGGLERLEEALDRAVTRTMTCFSQARQRILQALDRTAQATLDNPDVNTLLTRLLTVLMESSLVVDAAAVMLCEGDDLVVRAAVGLGTEKALGSRTRLGEGFMGEIGATREPLATRSASSDPRVRLEPLRDQGLRALYGVPLMDGDRLEGVAYMGSRTVYTFDDSDSLLFRTVMQRAMAHIVQAKLRVRERAARLEAEHSLALLDALLATAPVGFAFLDHDLRHLRVNQTLADLNGIPAEDHVGRPLQEVLTPAMLAIIEPPLRQVLETGEPVSGIEFTSPDPRSAPGVTWVATYFPVRTVSGELLGVGCTVVDVTEHKRAEAKLQQAVDFREQLLAVLGHDLRNPLHAIGASAFLLGRSEALGPPEHRALDRIRKATARMTRMINDILDFARSRLGGGIPVTRQHMNMADVCHTTLEELQVAYPERRLLLEARGDTWGDWDPDRVAQVLGNLVVNAIQHGHEGTPVRTTLHGEARDVVMEVHNVGDPIPEELLPRIFDPFKTPSVPPDEAARKRRSLGLGLYIVSQIAQVHGGDVRVHSTTEEGTTFRVRWPRRALAPDPAPPTP